MKFFFEKSAYASSTNNILFSFLTNFNIKSSDKERLVGAFGFAINNNFILFGNLPLNLN